MKQKLPIIGKRILKTALAYVVYVLIFLLLKAILEKNQPNDFFRTTNVWLWSLSIVGAHELMNLIDYLLKRRKSRRKGAE